MADPNWFYSTVTQSTAAVVGLVGGFVAARLLGQRADVEREAELLAPTVRNFEREFRAARLDVQAKVDMLEHLVSAYDGRIAEGRAGEPLNFTDAPSFLSSYSSAGVAVITEEQVDRMREFHSDARAFLHVLKETDTAPLFVGRSIKYPRLPEWLEEPPMSEFTGNDYWEQLAAQRTAMGERWASLHADAESVRVGVARFRAQIVPMSITFLLAVLTLLVVIGMIIPAVFLSANDAVSKWTLLIGFSGLMLLIVAYLAHEVRVIRQKADLTRVS